MKTINKFSMIILASALLSGIGTQAQAAGYLKLDDIPGESKAAASTPAPARANPGTRASTPTPAAGTPNKVGTKPEGQALLLPAVQSAREAARATECKPGTSCPKGK